MGAALSLPSLALPSVGTFITFAASCCGAATCSAVCSACGKCNNSMATRIAYAVILLLNSLSSWIMLTDWAIKKLQHALSDYTTITCNGRACTGFVAVQRINFALGFFHFIMALLLIGVNSTRDKRSASQNGFWGPKLIAWIGLIVITFLIPDSFFVVWGDYFASIGAILFLLLGLISLVDLAHTWAEYCLEKVEDTDSQVWKVLLIGSTLTMYSSSFAMTIVMYIFFAHSGCSMNQAAITVNLIFLSIVSVLSVHPAIQSANPRAGSVQAAVVCVYCTYLTLSAVAMEPDDQQCNPSVRARGARKTTIILGALVTFLTVAYTTTRAATYGLALGSGKGSPAGYSSVSSSEAEHGLVSTQPSSRREMRAQALRAAVESGASPASASDDSDDDSDDEDMDPKRGLDDERNGTQYNYTSFHVIFLLGTAWVATSSTQNIGADKSIEQGDFIPVGRTYWASWVKIVSAWVCYGIFGWTLVAPAVLPERFDY